MNILHRVFRYSYVTNNPLKYTDPSGYVFVPRDYEAEGAYYQMQGIIDDWNYRNQHRGIPEGVPGNRGGGGGGYSYSNGQYYYNNQPIPEPEARYYFIEPNAAMKITYAEATYFMLNENTAWANIYYEKSQQQRRDNPPNKVNLNSNTLEGFLEWFHFIETNRSFHYKENISYNVNDIVDKNSIVLSIHLKNWRLNNTVKYNGDKVEWNIADFEFYKKGHYESNYVGYVYADNPCNNLYRITLYYNYEAKITLNTSSYEAWEDMRHRIFGDFNH